MDLKNYYIRAIADLDTGTQQLQTSHISSLYKDIADPLVVILYSTIHMRLNSEFEFINKSVNIVYDEKSYPQSAGGYFHAENSRQLLSTMDKIEEIRETLNETEYAFNFDEEYKNHILQCRKNLRVSGGSPLPEGFPRVRIIQTRPAIVRVSTIELNRGNIRCLASLGKVGSGSYATVYQYHDHIYDKEFALKRANPDLDEGEKQRFKLEFDTLKTLRSPYIVEVYSCNYDPMEYTMEWLDKTIDDYIKECKDSLTLSMKKRLVYQVLSAFEYIHSKSLLHRDVSLSNVMLRQYDDVSIIKVTDFGLVKIPGSTLTRTQTEVKGSLADPELFAVGFANYQKRHEIYSLTLLAFFILTGKLWPDKETSPKLADFHNSGTTQIPGKRYKAIAEIRHAIQAIKENDL